MVLMMRSLACVSCAMSTLPKLLQRRDLATFSSAAFTARCLSSYFVLQNKLLFFWPGAFPCGVLHVLPLRLYCVGLSRFSARESKLARGASANGCLSFSVALRQTGDLSRVWPRLRLMTAAMGSSSPRDPRVQEKVAVEGKTKQK